MTDDQIQDIVTRYIIGNFESDNADCLHEMDEFEPLSDDDFEEVIAKALAMYRRAVVTVRYE